MGQVLSHSRKGPSPLECHSAQVTGSVASNRLLTPQAVFLHKRRVTRLHWGPNTDVRAGRLRQEEPGRRRGWGLASGGVWGGPAGQETGVDPTLPGLPLSHPSPPPTVPSPRAEACLHWLFLSPLVCRTGAAVEQDPAHPCQSTQS